MPETIRTPKIAHSQERTDYLVVDGRFLDAQGKLTDRSTRAAPLTPAEAERKFNAHRLAHPTTPALIVRRRDPRRFVQARIYAPTRTEAR